MTKFIAVCTVLSQLLFCAPQTANGPSPVYDHELQGDRWKAWNEIREQWLREVFPRCLKKNGLRMNCSDCERIMVSVVLEIGPSGRIVRCTVLDEHICGRPASRELFHCFYDYFSRFVFPEGLRNMRIVTSLGNGLKC